MQTDEANQKPHLTPEGKFALWMIVGEIGFFVVLVWLTNAFTAAVAAFTSAMVATAMRTKWESHREVWFWAVGLAIFLLESWLNSRLPWSSRDWFRLAGLPLGIFDFVGAWLAFAGAQKLFRKA